MKKTNDKIIRKSLEFKEITNLKKEITKLEDQIKYKDLDIEMYKGRITQIKKLTESKLASWQEL